MIAQSRIETAGTREKIVSVAARLFLDQGLENFGMHDGMKAAELTGGGFYRHFSSKDQLITEAIRAAFDRLFAMFDTATAGMIDVEALQRISTSYLEQSRIRHEADAPPYLCPLAQIGSELEHAAPEIQTAASERHTRLTSLLERCMADLPTSEAAAKATNIVGILVGAVTVAGLAPDFKAASRILEQAKTSVLDQTLTKVSLRGMSLRGHHG